MYGEKYRDTREKSGKHFWTITIGDGFNYAINTHHPAFAQLNKNLCRLCRGGSWQNSTSRTLVLRHDSVLITIKQLSPITLLEVSSNKFVQCLTTKTNIFLRSSRSVGVIRSRRTTVASLVRATSLVPTERGRKGGQLTDERVTMEDLKIFRSILKVYQVILSK